MNFFLMQNKINNTLILISTSVGIINGLKDNELGQIGIIIVELT